MNKHVLEHENVIYNPDCIVKASQGLHAEGHHARGIYLTLSAGKDDYVRLDFDDVDEADAFMFAIENAWNRSR